MVVLNITNLSHSLPEPIYARYCVSFLCRLRGLTFRRSLNPQEALLLVQPRENRLDAAIHWRPFYIPAQPARYILEMSESWLSSFCIGDQLDFEEKLLS
jgi:uncharacterized membrane protein (UPF0127 family)